MKSHCLRLFSGIFRCEDCESEFSLFRVKSLLCPECAGRLYEVLEEDALSAEELAIANNPNDSMTAG
jgi:Zn finger protein HypA/HybF involved in hydrogenase expression